MSRSTVYQHNYFQSQIHVFVKTLFLFISTKETEKNVLKNEKRQVKHAAGVT